MQFLAPQFLVWIAGLGALTLILYLFRRRPKQIRVSTLPFFKSLAKVYQESAWLRRLKKFVSFLLAALVIAGAAMALSRLVVAPRSDELRSVILLIDTSASMAAKDAAGKTRLEAAVEWSRTRLAGLPPGVAVMVMRYDRRPEILLPHSYDRRAVDKALEQLTVRPLAGEPAQALSLAKRLAALEAPAAIWHLTDRLPEELGDVAPIGSAGLGAEAAPSLLSDAAPVTTAQAALPEVAIKTINLGLATPTNVGITVLQLRAQPLEHGKAEAYVELQAAPVGEGEIETQIELLREGELVMLQTVSVPVGGSFRLNLPIDASQGPSVTLQVRAEGDVLPTDDVVHARVPEARPIRVAWVTPPKESDPFTQLALSAISEAGELEVFQVDPAKWPLSPSDGRPFDVVIFDKWLPEAWDENTPAIVMDPDKPVGPIRAARLERPLPLDTLRAVSDGHPILYGVASPRVSLLQTSVLDVSAALTPLWVGPAGPVMSAGEVGGQRLVVMGFSAMKSERLGYMASYPLLLGNAILWLTAPTTAERTGNNFETGQLIENAAPKIVWTVPGEEPVEVARLGELTELDRIGLFEVGELKGSASLLSREETALVSNPAPIVADASQSKELPLMAYFRGDLRPTLLWLVVFVLVFEAWLFHRLGVF